MVNTVVIGAGNAGASHAAAAAKLGMRILAVHDGDAEAAAVLAREYDATAVSEIGELRRLLAEADAMHLCTPHSERVAYVRMAAEAGVHVLSEKPVANTLAEAEEIAEICAGADIHFMVCFNHRFRFAMQRMITMVRSGAIGPVRDIHFYRAGFHRPLDEGDWHADPRIGSGMTVESIVHEIDTLLEMVDGIERVRAEVHASVPGFEHFDDYANVVLGLTGGAQCVIHASWSSMLGYSQRGVTGDAGAIRVLGSGQWDFDEFRIKTRSGAQEQSLILNDKFPADHHYSFVEANSRFLREIQNGTASDSPVSRGLETQRIVHAILESSRTGATVHLQPAQPAQPAAVSGVRV